MIQACPPNYWMMQLHPSQSTQDLRYVHASLAAGFIGLDFTGQVTESMQTLDWSTVDERHKPFHLFYDTMRTGDYVLIMAHNQPVALVEVTGEYRFEPVAIRTWFRHMRAVEVIGYYGDFVPADDPREPIIMGYTIGQQLAASNGPAYRLIDRWAAAHTASKTAAANP